jgi:hypothetical protein
MPQSNWSCHSQRKGGNRCVRLYSIHHKKTLGLSSPQDIGRVSFSAWLATSHLERQCICCLLVYFGTCFLVVMSFIRCTFCDQRALYSVLSYIRYILVFLIYVVFYNFQSRPVVCFIRLVLKSPFLIEDRRI